MDGGHYLTFRKAQIREAYDDFTKGSYPVEIDKITDPSYFITVDHDEEQPRNFDNREIHEK